MRGSRSLGGNSRCTGHLVQAGCAPFSVNLLSGSACFHGDLTSEIFHLGCQMPVDEAKPPRVTKYRHDPTGLGAGPAAGSGWESGRPRRLAWGPLRAVSLGPVLPVDRSKAGWPCVYPCFSPHSGAGRVRGVPRQAVSAARGGGLSEPGRDPLQLSHHMLQATVSEMGHEFLALHFLFGSLQHALKFFDKLNPTTYNLLNRARGSDVETGGLQQVAVK